MTESAHIEDVASRALGRPPDVLVSAPGRVNLIGEHTDYNDGFVLPTVIPQRTHVAIARRTDERVTVHSETLNRSDDFVLGEECRRGGFVDYVQGVTAALRDRGFQISGFDAAVASDVPVGSGLSSSAALEVALLRGLAAAFALTVSPLAIARLARWGENHVVGAPVGILDPMACSMGAENHALFVDTRSLETQMVPIPSSLELVVLDSGVTHDHASGGYRVRRSECERAAALLGVGSLRDLTDIDRIASLPAPLGARVRHVWTENRRVLRARDALAREDLRELGQLFWESHASMRDDYEVSVPEVDRIVERARKNPDVFGARLTGGGFGGAVVVAVRAGTSRSVARDLETLNGVRTLVPRASDFSNGESHG